MGVDDGVREEGVKFFLLHLYFINNKNDDNCLLSSYMYQLLL
jgi:hypothetical protein